MFLLDQACKPVNEAFGDFGCYLVGTASERQPYRDVDVRFIMTDKQFDRLEKAVKPRGVAFLGIAIGQHLASLTGLPIDFQIQRQTEANHHHGSKRRNPLGGRSLDNYEGDSPRVDMAKMLVQIQAENPSDVLDTPGVRTVVPEGEQS
jgi:hypothetical protein